MSIRFISRSKWYAIFILLTGYKIKNAPPRIIAFTNYPKGNVYMNLHEPKQNRVATLD
jgi:hypothetical protein